MPAYSLCEWLSEAWSMDDASAATRDLIGADAAFFLAVTRAFLRLLAIVAAFGVCVLLPIHYVGGTTGHLGGAHLPDAPRPFATQESISKMIGIVPTPSPMPTSTPRGVSEPPTAAAATAGSRTFSVQPNAFISDHTVQPLRVPSRNKAGLSHQRLMPRQFSVNSSSSSSLDLTLARAAAPASSVLSNGWSVQLASALDSLSIMQLPAGSSYLTAHLVAAYLISFLVYSTLASLWELYFTVRRELARKCGAAQHSIVVTGVPAHARDETELANRIETACRLAGLPSATTEGANVLAVRIVRQNAALHDLLAARRRCQRLLDQVSQLHRARTGRVTTAPGDNDNAINDDDDGVRVTIDASNTDDNENENNLGTDHDACRPLMRVSAREAAELLDASDVRGHGGRRRTRHESGASHDFNIARTGDSDDDDDDERDPTIAFVGAKRARALSASVVAARRHANGDDQCFDADACLALGDACCLPARRAPVAVSSCSCCTQVCCCGCCCGCSDVGTCAACAPLASALCGRPVDAIHYLEQRLEHFNRQVSLLATHPRGRAQWPPTDTAFVTLRSLRLRNALVMGQPNSAATATAAATAAAAAAASSDDAGSALMPKSAVSMSLFKATTSSPGAPTAAATTSSFSASVDASSASVSMSTSLLGDGVSVAAAPDPSDMNWRFFARPDENTFVRRTVRSLLISVNILALIIMWSFVSVFVVSMTSLSSLARRHIPIFSNLAHSHHVAIFEGVLPALLLGTTLYFLPQMLRAACRTAGYESSAALESVVFARLSLFLYYNQFFVFTIAAVLFQHFSQLASSPKTVAFVLASALPSVGVFFMILILLFGVPASALELTRLGTLIHRTLIARPVTDEQRTELDAPAEADVTNLYATHMLVLLLSLSSALAHPLVCVFACAYYGAQLLAFRHQFVHVYRARSADHVHTMWPAVHAWAMTALLIAQIGYCGLFVLKRGVWQLAATTPLPIFTLLAWVRAAARAALEPAHLDANVCETIDATRTEGMVLRAIGNGAAFDHPAFRELYGGR